MFLWFLMSMDSNIARIGNRTTNGECYAKLNKNYDGYHFSEASEGMYIPFSPTNAISRKPRTFGLRQTLKRYALES